MCKKNFKCISLFLGVGVILLLTSCALFKGPIYLEEPTNEKHSLVFGYIDMEEAPSDLKGVSMIRLSPKTDEPSDENPKIVYPWYFFSVNDGIFFHEFVQPGIYRFDSFGGSTFAAGYHYSFPAQGKKDIDPVIKKPGIYFVGSYKFKMIKKTTMFEQGEYDIIKINKPTEKEVLEKMLEYTGDTIWKKRISIKLKELDR